MGGGLKRLVELSGQGNLPDARIIYERTVNKKIYPELYNVHYLNFNKFTENCMYTTCIYCKNNFNIQHIHIWVKNYEYCPLCRYPWTTFATYCNRY